MTREYMDVAKSEAEIKKLEKKVEEESHSFEKAMDYQ